MQIMQRPLWYKLAAARVDTRCNVDSVRIGGRFSISLAEVQERAIERHGATTSPHNPLFANQVY